MNLKQYMLEHPISYFTNKLSLWLTIFDNWQTKWPCTTRFGMCSYRHKISTLVGSPSINLKEKGQLFTFVRQCTHSNLGKSILKFWTQRVFVGLTSTRTFLWCWLYHYMLQMDWTEKWMWLGKHNERKLNKWKTLCHTSSCFLFITLLY